MKHHFYSKLGNNTEMRLAFCQIKANQDYLQLCIDGKHTILRVIHTDL